MNKEQLESLCGDPLRESIAKPFSFQLEGKWWNGATNGHAIAICETMSPDYVRANSPPVKDLFPVRKKGPSHTLDVGALSDWLEACKMWIDCPACKGGELKEFKCGTCDGDGEVECSSCGSEQECEECGGAGKSLECFECEGDKGAWAQLSVRFGHVQFNRTLLARYLAPFRASGIAKLWLGEDELDPFEIRGDGWRVLVMTMKPQEGDEEIAVPSGLIEAT